MNNKQAMRVGHECHAGVTEAVARGVVVDGVSTMCNGLDKFNAFTIDAAHAGERDGEVEVATIENTWKMAVLALGAMRFRPDDKVRLMWVLDDYCIECYPGVVLHDLDESIWLRVPDRLLPWHTVVLSRFGADNVVGQN